MLIAVIAMILGFEDAQKLRDDKIARLSAQVEIMPRAISLYSERGDLYFQSGKFPESVADYQKMVELNPRIDAQHWRLGLALYYVGKYKESAKQLEKYQAIDDIDRENGLWRFLAMVKDVGKVKARKELIPYTKSDRPPFDDIYKMFEHKLDPETFSKSVSSTAQEGKQRFYADLYLGLYYDVEGKPDLSLKHLKAAEQNEWGKNADGGPGWMWHIARLHQEQVKKELKKGKSKE